MIVKHGRRVLFGKRGVDSSGFEWQLPGGWIEAGESPQQAARREVLEETGLQLQHLDYVGITSNVFSDRKHSISLYFEAECRDAGTLITSETGKCLGWEWRNWEDVSEGLFLPLRLLKKTDYRPNMGDKRWTYVSI